MGLPADEGARACMENGRRMFIWLAATVAIYHVDLPG